MPLAMAVGPMIVAITIPPMPVQSSRFFLQAKRSRMLILDLQKSLKEVKALRGLLPICSSCKKVRDDKGYWNQIESYIQERSDAEFSHSICPECAKKLYPDLYK
jgi:hypothetical protein